MNQEGGRRAIEKLIQTYGCLPSAADGPVLPGFSPVGVADAIAHEIARARDYGWSKITMHMDLPDAAQLAAYLRHR